MSYDAIGNITNKGQTDWSQPVGGAWNTVPRTTYTNAYQYNGFHPHRAVQVGARSITYDDNGNQIDQQGGGEPHRVMAWDEENNLRSVTDNGVSVQFRYDASGTRTHRSSAQGVSQYASQWYSVRNGTLATKHIFAAGTRVASVIGSLRVFFHPDHLGSTHIVTSEDGNVRERFEQLPFGEPWIEDTAADNSVAHRFTGKELDPETGLYYFGARYYDPRQSQWASVDPALGMTDDPLNRWVYTYGWNTPMRVTDPDGRWPSWNDVWTTVTRVISHPAARVVGGAYMMYTSGSAMVASGGTVSAPAAVTFVAGADQFATGAREWMSGHREESTVHTGIRVVATPVVGANRATVVANVGEVLVCGGSTVALERSVATSGTRVMAAGNRAAANSGQTASQQVVLFENLRPDLLSAERASARALGAAGSTATAESVAATAGQRIKWVVTASGELRIGAAIAVHAASGGRSEISHAVLSNGGPVQAAGEALIESGPNGFVGQFITPHSGHFFRGLAAQSQAALNIGVEAFRRLGITFQEVSRQ
jgi:RHS repeat-associated protein